MDRQAGEPAFPSGQSPPVSDTRGLEVPGCQPVDFPTHPSEESESQEEQEHIVQCHKYASKSFKNQITQIKLILRGSSARGL